MNPRHFRTASFIFGTVILLSPVNAQRPNASATEIRLGQTAPYSGPVSAYSAIAKTQAAYFRMINEHGGINGRKINLISYDDSYSPPKTVEQVRRLVEGEEVLATFQTIDTATNAAIQNT